MRITAQALSVAVGNRTLFANMNFTWEAPGVIAVVGPSGIGKSTLLSVVIGWTRPVAGTLSIEPARSSVWLVPQTAPLLDSRTTYENLEVALLARNGPDRPLGSISEVLHTFGLSTRANNLAKDLSGGERQRVALARAALRRPEVLLADEVTAGLDATSVEMVTAAMAALASDGTLVIVATHDERVWSQADEVVDLAAIAT
jgi:lipoprotein-releasing system ATP-binding protein